MKFVIIATMNSDIFEILKKHKGSHKKVAEFIGLSYTRYNEWRWDSDNIPKYGVRLLELAVSQLDANSKKKSTNV